MFFARRGFMCHVLVSLHVDMLFVMLLFPSVFMLLALINLISYMTQKTIKTSQLRIKSINLSATALVCSCVLLCNIICLYFICHNVFIVLSIICLIHMLSASFSSLSFHVYSCVFISFYILLISHTNTDY